MTLFSTAALAQEDPYLWLEDVTGEKAVEWVKEQNKTSQGELEARPEFKALHERLLAIYNSRERIPFAAKRGAWLYNFWQDADNPRGIWRRTTMDEYRKPEPRWETVIDIGKLSADENEKWVFKGASCLYPDYERCLVSLSRAGADAVEVREFDARAKQWVKDGFRAPESKGELIWRDRDTVYAARDFGAGSLTTSGYPRTVREWKRGTPLADAHTIFEGRETDVSAGAEVVNEPGRRYEMLTRAIDFWNSEHSILRGGKWVRLETPLDSQVYVFNEMLVVKLRTDWKPGVRNFRAGSLIATSLDGFLSGKREFEGIFEPRERVSLQALAVTKNFILLDVLDNVKGRVVEARLAGGTWKFRDVAVPAAASIGVSAVDRDESDDYWMTVTS
ncbi:MAG TPA: hypothetical protein VNU21_02165, partial [Usitatibacter sp.]|nr:hypothetical protein [Usitatibacter sp.]